MTSQARSGYANGRDYVETQSQIEGEFTTGVHYLLDNGRRHRVAVDMAVDSPQLRHKIGLALAAGKRGLTK